MAVAQTINNKAAAKRYFQRMGCSHFHMARENEDRYKEYCWLHIPKHQENEWKLEELSTAIRQLQSGEYPLNDLWHIHSRASDLVLESMLHTQLEPLLLASSHLDEVVDSETDRLRVAATILGRQDVAFPSGLIFRCHDLFRTDLASRYAALVTSMTAKPLSDSNEEARRQSLRIALEKTLAACQNRPSIIRRIILACGADSIFDLLLIFWSTLRDLFWWPYFTWLHNTDSSHEGTFPADTKTLRHRYAIVMTATAVITAIAVIGTLAFHWINE